MLRQVRRDRNRRDPQFRRLGVTYFGDQPVPAENEAIRNAGSKVWTAAVSASSKRVGGSAVTEFDPELLSLSEDE